MPVFEQGYVRWEGRLQPAALRWWPILKHHLLLLLRRRLVLVLLGLSLLGVMAGVLPIMLAGTFGSQIPGARKPPELQVIVLGFLEGQSLWVVLLSIFAGSGLVARDLQTRSLLLYLSRPLTRLDYSLGKFGVLAVLLAVPTLLPGLLLLLLHALVNQEFAVFAGPALTVVLAVSAAYVLLGGAIALGASTMTSSPRIAGIACLGIWMLGALVADNLHRAYPGDWPQLASPARIVFSIGEQMIAPLKVAGDAATWDRPLDLGLCWAVIGGALLCCWLLLLRRLARIER